MVGGSPELGGTPFWLVFRVTQDLIWGAPEGGW